MNTSICLAVLDTPSASFITSITPRWTAENIFVFSILFTWIIYVWETYIEYRQFKVYTTTKSIPAELQEVMDQDTFAKARLYQMDRACFGFLSDFWSQSETTIILFLGGLPTLWNVSLGITLATGFTDQHEIIQTAYFSVLSSFLNTFVSLPWVIYRTFVIEERHGFNKQTWEFFIKDRTKKFLVTQAIVVPIVSSIVKIIMIGGDYFFVYLWIFCLLISLVMITLYADYIAPLFDKFTPLPDGNLRREIETLSARIGFPLKKVYVVEGSKRSAHSNAYFYGFHENKRIVLFDTLLEDNSPLNEDNNPNSERKSDEFKSEDSKHAETQSKKTGCSDEEVMAILAHELGHWKHNHVVKNLVFNQVYLFSCFMLFSTLFKDKEVYKAFGFPQNQPVLIGLNVIFNYIFSPLNTLVEFAMTFLSRKLEFEADSFAVSLGYESQLRNALLKLNTDNLGFPVYARLYSLWYLSHPPLLERIQALRKEE